MSKEIIEVIGTRYGNWTVIGYTEDKQKVRCRCDCGKEKDVKKNNLRTGHSQSCGCKKGKVTHGGADTRLYRIWVGMKRRCTDKNLEHYDRYGGRGIKVCDEWKNDFLSFQSWMLSQGYDETCRKGEQTLDRIDNDGNYSPDNCRLATIREQSLNRSTCHFLEYNGVIMTIQEWSEKTGIKRNTIHHRLNMGWSVEKTLTTPVKKIKKPMAQSTDFITEIP